MDPILVQIGPIAIRWYGVLIALGVVAGGAWGVREAWPEPSQDTFGACGRVVFADDLWSGYRGIGDLGADVALAQRAQLGGEIVRIARSGDPSARERPPP